LSPAINAAAQNSKPNINGANNLIIIPPVNVCSGPGRAALRANRAMARALSLAERRRRGNYSMLSANAH
jgi:hypothetical protein